MNDFKNSGPVKKTDESKQTDEEKLEFERQ